MTIVDLGCVHIVVWLIWSGSTTKNILPVSLSVHIGILTNQVKYSAFHNIDCIKAASQFQSKLNKNVEKHPLW